MDTPHLTLEELATRVAELSRSGSRVLIGIAGAPGAGKTTLVEDLVALLRSREPADSTDDWVAHVPMDGFHLADAQLDRLGLRDVKGAPGTFDALGYASTLRRIAVAASEVYVPGFERSLEQPIAAALVVPTSARLVLTEGNYLLLDDPAWQAARAELTEVWYVDLPDDVRRERLIARHVAFGKEREEAAAWVDGSDAANAELVATSRATADLVFIRA